MTNLSDLVVMIKGGGKIGSAVAHRLAQSHFKVYITEMPHPTAINRGVTFCEAILIHFNS
jgi:xanthine dehydrogenase accessory factor